LENSASYSAADLRHVIIAVNPKAGATAADGRVARLADLLQQQGLEVAVLSNLDAVADQSNRLHSHGCLRTLIGVGGDGTAAELVNRTLPGVPLTILPSGNENLLARHFGLGSSPEECAKTVLSRALVQCDAGRANDRIFLVMCSCGFDADVVHALHLRRTGHVNSASYFNPIMDTIRHYEYPELHIYWNDGGGAGVPPAAAVQSEPGAEASPPPEPSDGVRWLFAFNMPCYGGGLQIAPEADAADGLLDVCTFRHGGLLHGLYYTAAVLTGTHQWLSDFAQRRSGSLRVTSAAKVPYQLDGDPGGFLPVEIAVVPNRLTLVVPQEKR
jgi:diacylglycerol kinase (ATP)